MLARCGSVGGLAFRLTFPSVARTGPWSKALCQMLARCGQGLPGSGLLGTGLLDGVVAAELDESVLVSWWTRV